MLSVCYAATVMRPLRLVVDAELNVLDSLEDAFEQLDLIAELRPVRLEARLLNVSLNHFDVRPVTWRIGERHVTGDERRIERLCEGDVHGVVRCDVLAQLPRTSQEISVRVPVEIEVGEVRNCLGRPVR